MTEEMQKAAEEELEIICSLLADWVEKYGIEQVNAYAISGQYETSYAGFSWSTRIDIHTRRKK